MNIEVYYNTSPPNKVNKSIHQVGSTIENVRFTENGALDILQPELLFQYTNDVADLSKINYVRIPKFSRYYYVDDISTEGGLVRIKCRVDVLMSHKKSILASQQYILRQETKYKNPYLPDDKLPITSKHNYYTKKFDVPVFDKTFGHVLLATTGTGGTPI